MSRKVNILKIVLLILVSNLVNISIGISHKSLKMLADVYISYKGKVIVSLYKTYICHLNFNKQNRTLS